MFYDTIQNIDEDGRPEVDATEVPRDELLAAALEALCDRWEEHANQLEADSDPASWAVSQEKASVYSHVVSSIRREIAYANISSTTSQVRTDSEQRLAATTGDHVLQHQVPTEDVHAAVRTQRLAGVRHGGPRE